MRCGRYRVAGFNLLEVIIAAFIFSLVSISFLGVWGQQVRALEKSRHLMVATLLAEQKIEESMTHGYERSTPTKPEDGPEILAYDLSTETRSPTDPDVWVPITVTYTTSREIKDYLVPGSTDPSLDKVRQVIVKVTWQDTTKTGEVVLETFLAGSQ